MSVVRFFDTNILVYGYDKREPRKRQIALEWIANAWAQPELVAISIQVLQELYSALLKRGTDRNDAIRISRDFEKWVAIENTVSLLHAAWLEQDRWQTSIWDSLILAAARQAGAVELISEDFSHGQDYSGIVAINPFR